MMENAEHDHNERCEEGMEEIAFLSRKILELNKQLIESEKAKSRFLSLVASELNNPMTALLGLIPHLSPPAGSEKRSIYETVHAEALVLDFRIQNLVPAALIESGECDLSAACTDLGSVVQEVLESLKYALNARKCIVSINATLGHSIVTDAGKIYLILKNLIANACTYGDAEGLIEIAVRAEGNNVILDVTNRGEGPKVEFKPQVFTRFAEGPEGLHGLGVGLSVVRSFCELMEGSVDYTVGEGTVTFTVTLPIDACNPDSTACGANEFLFESFEGAVEI